MKRPAVLFLVCAAIAYPPGATIRSRIVTDPLNADDRATERKYQ
ncbi:MAG TPA: hypothetical protein VNH18_18115 [Bryobacteraceae bacterium]|nr:hypothetical protein [Bryobacteraceae bacterium]